MAFPYLVDVLERYCAAGFDVINRVVARRQHLENFLRIFTFVAGLGAVQLDI
jgi:hypothetical protein